MQRSEKGSYKYKPRSSQLDIIDLNFHDLLLDMFINLKVELKCKDCKYYNKEREKGERILQ